MADSKKKETKVLSLQKEPESLTAREKKLKELQSVIDQGLYKVSAMDIAKAYLYDADHDEDEEIRSSIEKKPRLKIKKT